MFITITAGHSNTQPPSGGCVLKLRRSTNRRQDQSQPPSGGCVLKQTPHLITLHVNKPAAFGRLYVETVATSCFEEVS